MDQHERDAVELGIPVDHALVDTADTRAAMWGMLGTVAVAIGLVVLVIGGAGVWWLVAVIVVGVVVAAFSLRKGWVAYRWQNPQLFLPSSEPLLLGSSVVCRYRRRLRSGGGGASGSTLTAELICIERATYTAGTERHTVTETVYRGDVPTVGGGEGRTVEADLQIAIPLFAAPPTMDLGDNEIAWRLEVDLTAPGAPDDKSTFPIVVAPEVAL